MVKFDLNDFVTELLEVSEKYGVEDIFEGYIGKFIKDMKAQGAITNESGDDH